MRFVIPGKPIGKQSVRVTNTGHAFLPSKTRTWLGLAVDVMSSQWSGASIEGPVELTLVAVMPRPKRLMRKMDPDHRLWCDAQPDVDNISKAVCDAITRVGVWRDDKQVAIEKIYKVYAAKDESPHLEVEILEMVQQSHMHILCPAPTNPFL